EYTGGPSGVLDEVRVATKLLIRDVLSANSGELALRVSEEGATVKVNGTIVGSSPVANRSLGGGMHTIEIEKRGFIMFTQDVEIKADTTTDLDVTLRPSEEFLDDYRNSAGTVRKVAWISLGVGAAGVLGAVAMYIVGATEVSALNADTMA